MLKKSKSVKNYYLRSNCSMLHLFLIMFLCSPQKYKIQGSSFNKQNSATENINLHPIQSDKIKFQSHQSHEPVSAWHFEVDNLNQFTTIFSDATTHVNKNFNKKLYYTHLFDRHFLVHLDEKWHASRHPSSKKNIAATASISNLNILGSVLETHPLVKSTKPMHLLPRRKPRDFLEKEFTDPLFNDQWHLINNYDIDSGVSPTHDLNIMDTWNLNITGKNVTVAIIDDGVDYKHPDLAKNYNPKGSYDLNNNDDDPYPRYAMEDKRIQNTHGTKCAGEISAVANNGFCGVGVAYDSSFTAIKILDGGITDAQEAISFSKHLDINEVFNLSWGPDDDGKTVDGPHSLARKALEIGTKYGRYGLGAVYVVASGNGGAKDDNCNFDGYANSLKTITIGVVDKDGDFPSYAEICSSMLASAYSGSSKKRGNNKYIVTTDWNGKDKVYDKDYCDRLENNKECEGLCTPYHSGTSAATPLATGVIALVLQANPCLTWRDVQWLVVLTSDPQGTNTRTMGGFEFHENGAGLKHSHHYGFGVFDTNKIVAAALDWTEKLGVTDEHGNLRQKYDLKQQENDPDFVPGLDQGLGQGEIFEKSFSTDILPKSFYREKEFTISVSEHDLAKSASSPDKEITLLEQVVLTITLDTAIRGNISVTLSCPENKNVATKKVTHSRLITTRKFDDSKDGFVNWSTSTIRCFGEYPHGDYGINISSVNDNLQMTLKELKIELYGLKMTRDKFNELKNFAQNAQLPKGQHAKNFKIKTSKAKCARLDYANIPDHIAYLIRYEKVVQYLKAIAFLVAIWTVYCFFDCGCLDDEEEKEARVSNNYAHEMLETSKNLTETEEILREISTNNTTNQLGQQTNYDNAISNVTMETTVDASRIEPGGLGISR